MDSRVLVAVAVAFLVVTSGCATVGSSLGDDKNRASGTSIPVTTTQTTQQSTTEPTQSTTESTTRSTTTSGTTNTSTTTTTEPEWSQPKELNTPLEKKYRNESQRRITSISIGGDGSAAEGYSSVEVQVTANTSMRNIDPEDHGSVEGEPFLVVFLNGHLATSEDTRFATPRGYLVARSPILEFQDDGTFTLTIPQEAFESGGTQDGEEVTLMIMLMDRDSEWDDIYGVQKVELTYDADA